MKKKDIIAEANKDHNPIWAFGLGYGNEEIMDVHRLKYPVAKMRQLVLTELSEQELNGLEESELYQIVMSCIKKLN